MLILDKPLTPREAETLELLCTGKNDTDISLAMSISKESVKKNLVNIYKKLRVKSRHEAIVKVYKLKNADIIRGTK